MAPDGKPAQPGRRVRLFSLAFVIILGASATIILRLLGGAGEVLPSGPCRLRFLADELASATATGEKLRHGADLPSARTPIMGDTYLRSILASPRQRIVFAAAMASPRRLDFQMALLPAWRGGQTSKVIFRVKAADDPSATGGQVLFEETVDPASAGGRWVSGSVKLTGLDVDGKFLVLETEPAETAGEGFPEHLPVWGGPVLVAGGESTRPNVVLIVLRGMRSDRLGCLGGRKGATPNIDALAARGTLCDSVIAPSPDPERSFQAFMTGRSPAAMGAQVRDPAARLRRYMAMPGLAAEMRRSGRVAAAFTGGGEAAGIFGLTADVDALTEFTPATDTAKGLGGRAAAWIRHHRREPFFVMLHSAEPSPPWLDERFGSARPAGRTSVGFGVEGAREAKSGYNPTEADTDYARAMYDGDLAACDDAVGRVVEALRSSGILDRTVIAVTSTCGAEIFEHDWWGVGTGMTDEYLRVPLVMAGAGIKQRRVSTQFRLERVKGMVLAAAEGGDARPLEDPVILSGWPLGGEWRWSVRTSRWKLAAGHDGKGALFSLVDDPAESKDVAGSHERVASLLAEEISRYRRYCQAVADGADGASADYEPSDAARKFAADASEGVR